MAQSKEYRYSKEHEWARKDPAGYAVGITDYAQQELGDVVFVDLPEEGKTVKQGEAFATVESVKAVSEIYAPLDGTVVKVNDVLADRPELINSSPEDQAWIVVIEAANAAQLDALMDSGQYAAYIKEVAK